MSKVQKSFTGEKAPQVVVCIPAFNEAKTIGTVVLGCKLFADKILVCDDGSSDGTSIEAEKRGAVVFHHKTNLGKGAALKTLIEEASRLNPAIVVTIDGDDQHNPSDIPKLVAPITNGTADIVVGCRFNGENQIPIYRRVGNFILTMMTNWSAGTTIRDTQSGFRAYSSIILPHIRIEENGMGVDSLIIVRAAQEGYRISEENISVSYVGDTSTFNPLSHMLRVTWSLAKGNYQSVKGVPGAFWILAFVGLTVTLMTFSFALMPFSWGGLAVSTLAIGVGSLAIVLGPSAKLVRWARRAK